MDSDARPGYFAQLPLLRRATYQRTEGARTTAAARLCGLLVMPPDAPLRRAMPDESSSGAPSHLPDA